MRKYVFSQSPRQETFLPPCPEDVAARENPVRFIAAFVDSLNLRELGFTRTIPAQTGRPPYSPRCMLKLHLYRHRNRVRSSRMPERECGRKIELWRLPDNLRPAHNTIAIFRAMKCRALLKVFRLFEGLCAEPGARKRPRARERHDHQSRQRQERSRRKPEYARYTDAPHFFGKY